MMRQSRLTAILFGCLLWAQLCVSAALASQATLVTPASPLSMTGLASFLNSALLSLGSCNAGNSAPANGTGNAAFAGECWINTTASPWVFSYTADGTHWTQFGSLNTSTFVWTPYSNGFGASLGGTFTTAAAFTQSGAFPLTLTVTGTTNATLPAGTHTLAGLDVNQTFSGTDTFSGTLNMTGAFQVNGNLMTFPGVAATLAYLAGNQTWTGSNNFTGTFQIGGTTQSFPSSGNLVGTSDAQTLTNKTFNCANNICTVRLGSDVTGQLPVANGGTGAATQSGAANNIFPTPTRAGDLPYWNGSGWGTLAGNNSGTNCFSENASGVPAWALCGSGGSGFLTSVTTVTGASTTYTSGQNNELVSRSNSGSPMIDTLPGTSPGILPSGTLITAKNNDTAGVLAINAGSGASLKGQAAPTGWVYICPGQSSSFFSDGTNYWAVGQAPVCKLKAATTFYAAASGGSSTNHGLTSGSPLDSCAHAYQLAQSVFDMGLLTSAQSVTIQCGTVGTPGQTFGSTLLSNKIPGQLSVDGQAGIFPVIIQGDTTTPGNITFSATSADALAIEGDASLLVQGFTFTTTTSGNGIDVIGARVAVKTENFGTAATNHIAATHHGFVEIVGNYSLTGTGAQSHWLVSNNSGLYVQAATAINYSANQTWSTAFIGEQYASVVVLNVVPTYPGAGTNTGPKWSVFLNSVLNAGGTIGCTGSTGNVPGTTGSCATGGQVN